MNNQNDEEIFVDLLQPQSVSSYGDDTKLNITPDQPSQGESKGTEVDKVVANLDVADHYDNST